MRVSSLLRSVTFAAAALAASAVFAQTPVGVPSKVVGVYFTGWSLSAGEDPMNIRDVTQDANVIFLFTLVPDAGEVGTWQWPWTNWPSQADVQFVRARGQKVVLTLGGSGYSFKFDSRAKTQATLDAIRAQIANFGPLDGINLNTFEGSEPVNGVDTPRAALSNPDEIAWLMQQLRAEYGGGFALVIPPAPAAADLQLATALANNGALTFAAPQFYDWDHYKLPGVIHDYMRDWVNAIGQERSVIGLSANYNSGHFAATDDQMTQSPTLTESEREWDAVVTDFPNVAGVVAWTAQFNHQGGGQWTAAMRQRVLGVTPQTCASAALWDSTVRYFPGDVVNRNGQLYVATDASADPTWNVNSPPEWTPSLWSSYSCTP